MTEDSKLLNNSLLAALCNTVVAIVLRIITFVLNGFILRRISPEVLGIINVRLLLLVDSIIFISREAFRKACLKKPENGDWRGTINLIWRSVPIGIVTSIILGYLWIFPLELQPQDVSQALPSDLNSQYAQAVVLVSISAIGELCIEPFFAIGQIFMMHGFRSFVDLAGLIIRAILLTLAVIYSPSKTVVLFGWAHLFSTIFQWLAYFLKINRSLRSEPNPLEPLSSIKDLMPSVQDQHIDQERWTLTTSFLKQGLLKQLLTEGEKYLFTWFKLMTLEQQGIYDVVGNLGSLAARLVFSKVEESAYLYFNQSVNRGKSVDPKVATNLKITLRAMTLFGLVVLTFGYSYSHLLLHIYGGANLSQGLGPILLRGHCVFVFLMAINGITECYSFAVMTSGQVDRYNYVMTLMAFIFLAFAWMLSKAFGPLGFIMANWCNFIMRIAHSCKVIYEKHGGSGVNPLQGLLPPLASVLVLFVSGVICQLSEVHVYDPANFIAIMKHLVVGGICFLISLLVIFRNETQIFNFLASKLKKK